MNKWTLIPHKGIQCGELAIHFGMSRSALREMMRDFFPPPQAHFEDEDDYENEADGTLIRVRFNDAGVQDIEFLGGILTYNGITLFGGGDWPAVRRDLAEAGNTFRDTEWLGDGQKGWCGCTVTNGIAKTGEAVA